VAAASAEWRTSDRTPQSIRQHRRAKERAGKFAFIAVGGIRKQYQLSYLRSVQSDVPERHISLCVLCLLETGVPRGFVKSRFWNASPRETNSANTKKTTVCVEGKSRSKNQGQDQHPGRGDTQTQMHSRSAAYGSTYRLFTESRRSGPSSIRPTSPAEVATAPVLQSQIISAAAPLTKTTEGGTIAPNSEPPEQETYQIARDQRDG
jgi:hypothetical protein